MSIIYSAIVPHSPLLIPGVGKENASRLEATIKSYNEIESDLADLVPDTILIISPHGIIQDGAFTLNLCDKYTGGFEEFGDFSTKIEMRGDVGLSHRLKESVESSANLQLISCSNLDYGTSIPAFLIARSLHKTRLVPLSYSTASLKEHFEFGKSLQKQLLMSDKKVAIIASGDMSHKVDKKSPAGYSPKGKKFDQKVITLLTGKKTRDILKTDQATIDEVAECALKSILILLGILDGINHAPKLLSYESPFGIGYLCMKFEIR